jgi:hypothetical protein
MNTIQSLAAQRQAVLASFDRVETDEEGAAASRELHRLDRAILSAPAICPADLEVKLSVFGSILTDYGEIIDGQAALWARLSEDVAAFTGQPLAEAA